MTQKQAANNVEDLVVVELLAEAVELFEDGLSHPAFAGLADSEIDDDIRSWNRLESGPEIIGVRAVTDGAILGERCPIDEGTHRADGTMQPVFRDR